MELVQNFPFITIVFSLTCGVLCAVLKAENAKKLCVVWLSATFLMSLSTFIYTLDSGTYYIYYMGRWSAPWGNEIRVGTLETLMASCFSGIMLLSLLGGMRHIFEDCDSKKTNIYFTMISLLMCSLLVLTYTNDLFTAYVFVEINTIASCAQVMMKRSAKTLIATTKYLIMSLLGSGLFLIGLVTLYGITGHLLMENIGSSIQEIVKTGRYSIPLTVVIVFLSVGLAIKSALFPFHPWLPDAHGSATTSSSAILSGLVLKGYIILLIKIFYRVFGLHITGTEHVEDLLFILGIIAMLFGSFRALKERDLKRMLAYSSVAQIGYIYVGIGLNTEAGMTAACLQIIAHAFTKPMLFCAAGGFMDVSGGQKSMEAITGAGRRDKLGGIAFTVGALSMIGLPFFAGFVTKLHLASSAVAYGNLRMIAVLTAIAVSTLLNALYYVPVIFNIFSRRKDDTFSDVKANYHWAYVIAMVLFISLNIGFGTFSEFFADSVRSGLAMFGL